MSDDEDRPQITPPKASRAADIARAAARAAAGAIPLAGSAVAELADGLLPDPTAKDRKRWEGDVTEGVNHLHGRVGELDRRTSPNTVTLENGAAAAARHMIQSCPDGLAQQWVSIEDLETAFPDIPQNELLDGLGDLESYGLIKTIAFIGSPSRYQLSKSAYQVLDPPIMGWDTNVDARELARMVLEMRDTISVPELEAKVGWPRRRFNPALRLVVGFIDEGRVSQSLQPDYVTRHFAPNNMERAQLRRFAAGD